MQYDHARSESTGNADERVAQPQVEATRQIPKDMHSKITDRDPPRIDLTAGAFGESTCDQDPTIICVVRRSPNNAPLGQHTTTRSWLCGVEIASIGLRIFKPR